MIYYLVLSTFIVILIAWIAYRHKARNLPIDFHGQRVLITGGSSGIGECIAYQFSKAGAFVTIASNQIDDVVYCFNL
jgi:NADPH:quinone reductase-like Zn-dependent oxidoreductase